MSCQQCEDFQDGEQTSYYRWKNANIEVRACQTHLKEVFAALNSVQIDEPYTPYEQNFLEQIFDDELKYAQEEDNPAHTKMVRGLMNKLKIGGEIDG